jgi:hypothetical protein
VKMVVHEHVGVEHDARHLQVVRQLAHNLPIRAIVSPLRGYYWFSLATVGSATLHPRNQYRIVHAA